MVINGTEYSLDELHPRQIRMIECLRLTETLGEILNLAHDDLVSRIAEEFPSESAE